MRIPCCSSSVTRMVWFSLFSIVCVKSLTWPNPGRDVCVFCERISRTFTSFLLSGTHCAALAFVSFHLINGGGPALTVVVEVSLQTQTPQSAFAEINTSVMHGKCVETESGTRPELRGYQSWFLRRRWGGECPGREGLVDRKQQVAFWALSPRKWTACGAALLPEALREKKGLNFRWETLNFCSLVCFSGLRWGWMGNVHNGSYSNCHIWYYLNVLYSYLCCKQCIWSLHKSVDVLLQDDVWLSFQAAASVYTTKPHLHHSRCGLTLSFHFLLLDGSGT